MPENWIFKLLKVNYMQLKIFICKYRQLEKR